MRTDITALLSNLNNLNISEQEIRDNVAIRVRLRRMTNITARWLYSHPEDTEMRALLEALLKYDGYFRRTAPERYVQWYHSHCISCMEDGKRVRARRAERVRIAAAIKREHLEQERIHEKYKDMPLRYAIAELYGEY